MTISYSQYAPRPYLTIGTALGASGTVVPPTTSGSRILLNSMDYWLQVPSGTVTVTLTLGSDALPPLALTANRSFVTLAGAVLAQDTGITAVLSGSGTVGFYGHYLIATND